MLIAIVDVGNKKTEVNFGYLFKRFLDKYPFAYKIKKRLI